MRVGIWSPFVFPSFQLSNIPLSEKNAEAEVKSERRTSREHGAKKPNTSDLCSLTTYLLSMFYFLLD